MLDLNHIALGFMSGKLSFNKSGVRLGINFSVLSIRAAIKLLNMINAVAFRSRITENKLTGQWIWYLVQKK